MSAPAALVAAAPEPGNDERDGPDERAFPLLGGARACEGVWLDIVADAVGTPVYVYSASAIEARYGRLAAALPSGTLIAYALKANPNLAVVATLARQGAGADVVSGGELARALRAGVNPADIVFSGVGKTADEHRAALAAGVGQINVESEAELEQLSAVATAAGATARVALRVNPDVAAATHDKIATGRREDKFGIPVGALPAAAALAARAPGLDLAGLALHIGSQITSLAPFERAFALMGTLLRDARAAGHRIDTMDLGGGLGVVYAPGDPAPPDVADYGALVARAAAGWDARIIVEPGRWLVADAGALVAGVTLVKEGADRRFVVLDAAMNDLMRPSLYGAHHAVRALRPGGARMVADIVGPACESGDRFAVARRVDAVVAGDRVLLLTAGAYGASLASTYNSRPRVAEVLVRGGHWQVVSRRGTIENLFAGETLPT